MARLTKRKEEAGVYRILVDGKPSAIRIVKGIAPKFGQPQEWHTFHDAHVGWSLCDGNGLDTVMARLTMIVDSLAGMGKWPR